MFTRAYGEGALFQMSALDAEGSPAGLVLEDAMTFAAADLTLYSDEIGATTLTAESVAFTSGSTKPSVGDTLTGATSTETLVVIGVVLTSGSWAGADAAGTLFVEQVSGVFQSENLDNTTTSASNVMTIGGDIGGVAAEIIGRSVWVALTSTEMACIQGNVEVVDTEATEVWLEFTFAFETYGSDSALHPVAEVDLSTQAKADVNAEADTALADYDPPTRAEATADKDEILGTAPLGTAMRGTDNAALASVATEARLAELDAANLPADVDTLLTRATEARLAELDAANLPADIDTLLARIVGTLASGTHEPQSGDAFSELTGARAEPGAVPAANAAALAKLDWLYLLARNKLTNDGTTQAVRDDGDTADIATAAVAEAGGTVTRDEWA